MGKIKLIAQREFNERVRKKSFIITTILMPIFFVAMMIVPVLMMNIKSDKAKSVIVVDDSGIVADKLHSEGTLTFTASDKPLDTLKNEQLDIFGILVIGSDIMENPKNVQLYTYQSSTVMIEESIASQIRDIVETEKLKEYNIDNLQQILKEVESPVSISVKQVSDSGKDKDSSSIVSIAAAYIFGFLIYMFVFIYGGMVMQGVIEEKSSKVLEVMVSSVKPFELMMGKILGIASVAITQFVIWVVFIAVVGGGAIQLFAGDMVDAAAAMQAGGPMPVELSGVNIDTDTAAIINTISDPMYIIKMLGGFLIYFIGGYLLYAAMFAAVGSSVDNEKDTQNLQLPITIPMILALFVMMSTMQDPNSPLAFWCSIIPFTSPIVMMARLPYGVPGWELILSIVLLYATFIGTVWLAGKIYRVGIFMYGKKPTFKELYKWTKYRP